LALIEEISMSQIASSLKELKKDETGGRERGWRGEMHQKRKRKTQMYAQKHC
jgi:hypothetical protein